MHGEKYRLGLKSQEFILFASRLVPEKGCHYLIDAFNKLKSSSIKLVIAGESVFEDRYSSDLKQRAGDNILFLGLVEGRLMKELLSHAYIYVVPSEFEGMSIGLLEAMSYGRCVLVSDIKENMEVVKDNGVSFKVGNVDDLHAKLEFLLGNDSLVSDYGTRARRDINKYNWDTVAELYDSFYLSLISQ